MSASMSDFALALRAALRALIEEDVRFRGKAAPTVRTLDDTESDPVSDALRLNADAPEIVGDALRCALTSPQAALPEFVRIAEVGTFALEGYERRGRLAGRVALITGSAQGFGKGIAEALVAEGACVVVADLNRALGETTAEELNTPEDANRGCAMFAPVDVTRLASTIECIDRCVARFGGLDLFISNAGVLKAGGLEEMTEGDFDLVTSVNYKGFFLCAKAFKSLALRQARFGAFYTDLIQVNSKSGLQGSNRNFAYAGSKFGGIGLVQSFALELLPLRVKVNAVCPGNYFDGPLWSDPEKGLFVQYLRAGKVPGAKTIEDVRRTYVDKVPMGRGCEPRDVARAIIYLHEQVYETGQALPVSGGQVMLN